MVSPTYPQSVSGDCSGAVESIDPGCIPWPQLCLSAETQISHISHLVFTTLPAAEHGTASPNSMEPCRTREAHLCALSFSSLPSISLLHRTTMSSFYTTKSGTCTHYIESGNKTGPLLLLLHGLGGSTETFAPLIPHLPLTTYRIIAIDIEGFGNTRLNTTQSTISIDRHVEDLSDVISHLQGSSQPTDGSIILIGHSLGSVIALQYAARHANAVAGLGLIGVGRSAAHISAARDRMLGLAAKTRAEGIDAAAELAMTTNFPSDDTSDHAREEVRKAVAGSDVEGYARTCEAMVAKDHADPDYSKITCPAVFISGDRDMISPLAKAEEIRKLLGGSSEIFVVSGGHQPILSDLQRTQQAVARLFELIVR